jgi:hypothetical protein
MGEGPICCLSIKRTKGGVKSADFASFDALDPAGVREQLYDL